MVAEFSDESASAYSGNRGPELALAMTECERLATEHGSCALIIQHSDRLARGDGRKAKHLVEYALWAIKANVTIRSVQDPQTFGDLLYAVVTGQRNHEDSARKSKATRDGLGRRRDGGKPVGAIPFGYRWQQQRDERGEPVTESGRAVTERVVDPHGEAVLMRMVEMVESGRTYGDVARALNASGERTQRRGKWTTRTVRTVLTNDVYVGESGYPRLIEPDRWRRLQDARRRLDPAAVQRRKGGRPTHTDDYLLRGIGRCLQCGSSLFTRRYASGRHYLCGAVRQAQGTCDAVKIPAELAEVQVINHLGLFIQHTEDWLAAQLKERDGERQAREVALNHERQRLADLDRQREGLLAQYRELVDDGDRLARLALEEVERIDRDRAFQEQVIAERDAVVSEWAGPPDLDAALEFYTGLEDLIRGRIRRARGAAAVNAALHEALAGIWFEMEPDRDRLLAEFELRLPRETFLPGGVPVLFPPARDSLPPVRPGMFIDPYSPMGAVLQRDDPTDWEEPPDPFSPGALAARAEQTGRKTLVYDQPVTFAISS